MKQQILPIVFWDAEAFLSDVDFRYPMIWGDTHTAASYGVRASKLSKKKVEYVKALCWLRS